MSLAHLFFLKTSLKPPTTEMHETDTLSFNHYAKLEITNELDQHYACLDTKVVANQHL